MKVIEQICSARVLEVLVNKVHQHLGTDFSGERSGDLLRRLKLLALEQGQGQGQDAGELTNWLETLAFADWDAAQVQALTPAFTVGETYFRRDAEALDWLAREYLPPLLARRRHQGAQRLRVWSAGCCTGEEAYSLLFLLDDLLGAERANWTLEVIASDINTCFLQRAEQGCYGQNAFRRNEEAFRTRHFQPEGRLWRVRPRWRGRIRFIQYNLANGLLPQPEQGLADIDLILCRNVLMYFSPERAVAALRRLLSCLTTDGLLLLSAVEAGIATQAGLGGFWAGSNYALAGGSRLAPRPALLQTPPDFAQPIQLPALKRSMPATTPWPPAAQEPAPAERVNPPAAPGSQEPESADAGLKPVAPEAQPVPEAQPAAARTDWARPHNQHWQLAQQAHDQGLHPQVRQALLDYLACSGLSLAQKHQACLLMARSWADQQQAEEAEAWLQRALALDPCSATAYWLLALLQQQSGAGKAALVAVQKALYLDPDFILAHFHQARLLRAEGRLNASNKALRVCCQLLERQAQDAPVPLGEGLSCAQLRRLCEQLMEGQPACPSL
ncbi:MAG: CheR family methyltransferase [Pseudomonas sp.]